MPDKFNEAATAAMKGKKTNAGKYPAGNRSSLASALRKGNSAKVNSLLAKYGISANAVSAVSGAAAPKKNNTKKAKKAPLSTINEKTAASMTLKNAGAPAGPVNQAIFLKAKRNGKSNAEAVAAVRNSRKAAQLKSRNTKKAQKNGTSPVKTAKTAAKSTTKRNNKARGYTAAPLTIRNRVRKVKGDFQANINKALARIRANRAKTVKKSNYGTFKPHYNVRGSPSGSPKAPGGRPASA